MPAFTSDIIAATGLRPDSLFLDLGSGVGNVVLQACLQTGCRSFGVEVMPGPAGLAKGQLEQFRMRCRMWGVEAGEVELLQGDMTDNRRVDELMSKADVVLVNNFVFREECESGFYANRPVGTFCSLLNSLSERRSAPEVSRSQGRRHCRLTQAFCASVESAPDRTQHRRHLRDL